MKDGNERELERGGVITIRVPAKLMASVEAVAANEGISRCDVARRALIRDFLAQESVA